MQCIKQRQKSKSRTDIEMSQIKSADKDITKVITTIFHAFKRQEKL